MSSIELVIEARPRNLGGFSVRRVLPAKERRQVGPFVFFDHMGPVDMPAGQGADVRPHPHIGLATITYLYAGEMMHRDSIGSAQSIRPGDVNWMSAGRGIAHSERTPPEAREQGGPMHGLQTWVALPRSEEESEPRFEHHPRATIPEIEKPGAVLHVVAGTAYDRESPVGVVSPTLYVQAELQAGAQLPLDDTHPERAVYVVEGEIECESRVFVPGTLFVLATGARVSIRANAVAKLALVGGAPLDGPRHIFWNFVSSSKERIELAKSDWRERRFPPIPGDDVEFIPLPE